MYTDIGEYIVGAYLKIIKNCDIVTYNVRTHSGKLDGLYELDVLGINHNLKEIYLCEVTTHLDGLAIGNNQQSTFNKIRAKHLFQQEYASKFYSEFNPKYMFWSPIVSKSLNEKLCKEIPTLEIITNYNYSLRISELKEMAKATTTDYGNIFFRLLQILEHLK